MPGIIDRPTDTPVGTERHRSTEVGPEPELGDKRCRLSVTKPAEVLLAAVVQGAIFAGVKAAVGRAGAATTRRLTGT